MAKKLLIGILAIQGDVSEHADSLRRALKKLNTRKTLRVLVSRNRNKRLRQSRKRCPVNLSIHTEAVSRISGDIVLVKNASQIPGLDALVIPGGESTTVGKLMEKDGVAKEISAMAKKGKPILGTCTGAILLAMEIVDCAKGQKPLGMIDISVRRNAFGRQRESFEAGVDFEGIGKFPGVFIRAPAIESVGEGADILCRFGDKIVGAKQGNIMALTFHPELTEDTRVHEYFLNLI